MPSRHLRIRTRGSSIALRQTTLDRDRLLAAHAELGNGAVEVVTIRTTGDRCRTGCSPKSAGKGLFAKAIEEALIAGHIDCAAGGGGRFCPPAWQG